MRNLEFKYIRAKNFICFGEDGFELDLRQGGNIVHVIGENLDQRDDESEREGSNGAGKSSIAEIIVYCLFGKTIKSHKKINHADVIHNKIGKGLEVEVIWDNYRVVRTRKPNSLRIWQSDEGDWSDANELTLGGIPATQKLVEECLGLTYETFVNVLIFTDNDENCFLEADGPQKREIVENLMALGVYRDYFEAAKAIRNELRTNIRDLTKEYDRLLEEEQAIQTRIDKAKSQANDWKKSKLEEIKELDFTLENLKSELKTSDIGKKLAEYREAQEKISVLEKETSELHAYVDRADGILTKKEDEHRTQKEMLDEKLGIRAKIEWTTSDMKRDLEKCQANIKELNEKITKGEEGNCPWCYGKVDVASLNQLVEKEQENQEDLEDKLTVESLKYKTIAEGIALNQKHIEKVLEEIAKVKAKREDLRRTIQSKRQETQELSKIKEPSADSEHRLLEQKIDNVISQIKEKQTIADGPTPFVEIIKDAEKELAIKNKQCKEQKATIVESERLLPYYDYYLTAFGDSGIRKFVIEGIIPALNNRVAYWLQLLLKNKYKLVFNNQFEETIERNPSDGQPFIYHLLSRSQARRMNLAVSQAFAHVMLLTAGFSPNFVFLDEVARSVDPAGAEGIYDMICELAKDKKVFVTTHHQDLKNLLERCDTIKLQMKDGYSRKV